eukprot:TRINITY_DN11382_c0_g1_i1.p1 TRINITY_DN11382_c0_g1~~TRINITY_DN11382_c0_g1_i1.p1  ORF type:complete len:185 (-),score=35.45 TRINITY_DN11382_c0_g1_i1:63-551(-)
MGKQNYAKGHQFEERVARYFKKRGKLNIKKNVILVDGYGNRSEIDIVYGYLFKHYVECKCYSSKSVPLEDVTKFQQVLLFNRINPSRGIFVTNSTFSPRAKQVPSLRLIDGEEFRRLERGTRRRIWILVLLVVLVAAYFANDEDERKRALREGEKLYKDLKN